jgi:hypothetical protein
VRADDLFLLYSNGVFETLAERDFAQLPAADGGIIADRVLIAALAEEADANIAGATVELASECSERSSGLHDRLTHRM